MQRLLVIGLLLATLSCVHFGQRLLTIQVEVDGKVVLKGIRGVPDNMPVSNMWDQLADVPFTVNSKESRPEQLSGNIVVRIKHIDRELGKASLKTLSLKQNADGSAWKLGKDEAERIKQAASG